MAALRVTKGVISAGLGFGGQFLLALPDHDIVAVANSWHIFGPGRACWVCSSMP